VGCIAATVDTTVANADDGKSLVVAGLVIEASLPSLPVSLTAAAVNASLSPILLKVGEQNS
jgi:hypothetical protein